MIVFYLVFQFSDAFWHKFLFSYWSFFARFSYKGMWVPLSKSITTHIWWLIRILVALNNFHRLIFGVCSESMTLLQLISECRTDISWPGSDSLRHIWLPIILTTKWRFTGCESVIWPMPSWPFRSHKLAAHQTIHQRTHKLLSFRLIILEL